MDRTNLKPFKNKKLHKALDCRNDTKLVKLLMGLKEESVEIPQVGPVRRADRSARGQEVSTSSSHAARQACTFRTYHDLVQPTKYYSKIYKKENRKRFTEINDTSQFKIVRPV